jgi:hypothetical protein
MSRAYYDAPIERFLKEDDNRILGKLSASHPFALDNLQRNAWTAQTQILKNQLADYPDGHIAYEYSIPRMGKRVDNLPRA